MLSGEIALKNNNYYYKVGSSYKTTSLCYHCHNSTAQSLHIGHVIKMLASGYRDGRFEPRLDQYAVLLSKILSLHYFSRLSC